MKILFLCCSFSLIALSNYADLAKAAAFSCLYSVVQDSIDLNKLRSLELDEELLDKGFKEGSSPIILKNARKQVLLVAFVNVSDKYEEGKITVTYIGIRDTSRSRATLLAILPTLTQMAKGKKIEVIVHKKQEYLRGLLLACGFQASYDQGLPNSTNAYMLDPK